MSYSGNYSHMYHRLPMYSCVREIISNTSRAPVTDKVTTQQLAYLLNVLLLLLLQGQLNEDLLELLVAVVDDELFKAVLLQTKGTLCKNLLILSALVVLNTQGLGWEGAHTSNTSNP